MPPTGGRKILYLATDAAGGVGQFAGIVKLGETMETSVSDKFEFPEEYRNSDIAVKELWAVVEAIKMYRSDDLILVIACDSTVTRSQLAKNHATDPQANKLLQYLHNLDRAFFKTVFVYSEDNVADNPSRGSKILEQFRFDETMKILSGSHTYCHQRGYKETGRNHKIALSDLTPLDQEMINRPSPEEWSGLDVRVYDEILHTTESTEGSRGSDRKRQRE
jgi:hypothetical protein